MRLLLAAILLTSLFAGIAAAQLGNGLNLPNLQGGLNGPGIQSGGSGGNPPPACSNSLDFSDACNSQYIGVL